MFDLFRRKRSEPVNNPRRQFLAAAGLAGAAAMGSFAGSPSKAAADGGSSGYCDNDILNFALNLEYLEAEFYSYAVSGSGIPESDTTGVGDNGRPSKPGTVSGGAQVPFSNKAIQDYAIQIADDELLHVTDLRQLLGNNAVAMPNINIGTAFTEAAVAAGIISEGETFDPYENDDNFLLGAFVFEDVGVTAYHGAAPLLQNSIYLSDAAGILAVEAYHAGNIRTSIVVQSASNASLITDANKISALRAAADGTRPYGHETPLTDSQGHYQVVAADPTTAIAFARSFAEVLKIVYLGNAPGKGGGFFPNGMNGLIR
jgi:hypothetical protein